MVKVLLTDKRVAAVKAEKGRQIDLFDESVTGLALRVSAGGRKSWSLTFTKPGTDKRARITLGTYPEMALATARKKARQVRGDVGEGVDPIAEQRLAEAAMTVGDLVESYIEQVARKTRSGADTARRLRKNTAAIATVKLGVLHRRDLTRVIDAVLTRGAPAEAATFYRNLKAMVRWAVGRGDLDRNLMEGMPPPAVVAPKERVLNEGEVAAVWRALPLSHMELGTARLLRMILATAQRPGEVAQMRLTDVDRARGVWVIPPEVAKNAKAHEVPLSPLALSIIDEQLAFTESEARRRAKREGTEPAARSVYVFPGVGGRGHVDTRAVARAVSRNADKNGRDEAVSILGAAPWTPHDLRRTAATVMEKLGVSPFTIAHILNHISVTKASVTSRVYAHYTYEKEKREALELLGGWLERVVDSP